MRAEETDLVLVRCRLAGAEGLRDAALRFCTDSRLQLQRAAWSPASGWAYAYARPSDPIERAEVAPLAWRWESLCPSAQDVDVSRLKRLQDLPGASSGERPTRHYVVETDPEAGWEEELAHWYQQEHLPGLASVPGCVQASRFVNLDAGPSSHACYGLVTEAVLGGPPWLAVRGTEWSSRVRPHFTNTRRTMMDVVV
ncbi:MAG: hypothetical protein KGL68_18340 [Burkholderiales bacterium]|nr:hypothetical protein [Burkholderiales bacterium]